jgi:hypothetical protein
MNNSTSNCAVLQKFVQHAHEQGFLPFELAVHDLFTAIER